MAEATLAYILLLTSRQMEGVVSVVAHTSVTIAVDRLRGTPGNGELCIGLTEDTSGTALAFLGWIRSAGGASSLERRVSVDRVHRIERPISWELLRQRLPSVHKEAVRRAVDLGVDCRLPKARSEAVLAAIREIAPELGPVITQLSGHQEVLNSPAAVRWRDERDAVRISLRIAGFDDRRLLRLWSPPPQPSMPFLAGLLGSTPEAALLDHDARTVPGLVRMSGSRADVHTFIDRDRRLEIANVNATGLEAALGTDLIYYVDRTRSFVFVQYKKLVDGKCHVDARFRDQLARLLRLEGLGTGGFRSSGDWRLGPRAAWFKLADKEPMVTGSDEMIQGQYLPAEYADQLLAEDCTRGERGGRVLGYGTVGRYVTNSMFIALVQDGWIGTNGVTIDGLLRLVGDSLEGEHSVVLAEEHGPARPRDPSRFRRPTTGRLS